MHREIYEKGRVLAGSGRVHLSAETRRATYFEVDGDTGHHRVRLMSDNTFNCTCTWGSLKGATHGSLCSHVVAAVLALAEDEALTGRPGAGGLGAMRA